MKPLEELVRIIKTLRDRDQAQITLLAACPNSTAVLEAAVKAAAQNHMPMLFAATLNQVDRDGGYTGWTPARFVEQINHFAAKYQWDGPLYACLDHGGPWLKDLHALRGLSYEQAMQEVRLSLTACLEAGYHLLHIDPTVDRTLPAGQPIPIEWVIERTVDLIEYAEHERKRLGRPPISYEVGTEEVHGGLVDFDNFTAFIGGLKAGLAARGLDDVWPCFIVGKVGTDLHTTFFDPESACRLYEIVAPLGSLIKGHYTDWVENPEAYPVTGMGGANLGPEFTSVEYAALADLCTKEADLCRARPGLQPSQFMQALERAVIDSGRWQKWLQPDEQGKGIDELAAERRAWLIQTGSRYVWTAPAVERARAHLYQNLKLAMPDPNGYVVDRIVAVLDRYANAFHLFDSLTWLEG